ncbi:MAG TPA: hypothetical protein PKW79_00165 [Rhabdochlamydiaceae bacterium]|nr:hypothetical protein [Rhabdochlamydiaceae bacterium]
MKPSVLILTLSLLAGCGKNSDNQTQPTTPTKPKGACAAPTVGDWRPVNYSEARNFNTLTLNEDCSGQTTYCNERFTYAPTSGNNVEVNVTQTNGGPECLPLGKTICQATYDTQYDQIYLTCGGGKNLTNNYNRLK